uniref:ARMET N-terminal domain-containing protein n=1 Tax=Rhizochromulina marina TaxID=1034831 RepID=A0A7S2RW28_9STRA|mmetsp:Transcript_21810/g.63466  ORF Transcript_21810/g.63466 Transcript_21810/m.63466 type:complete len:174 (+) Transcript_21810:172-693(+)
MGLLAAPVRLLVLASLWAQAACGDCPVCESMVENIRTTIKELKAESPSQGTKGTSESTALEAIRLLCDNQVYLETAERKFCYYLDPLQQAAARALKLNMPKAKICAKLNRENPDICSLAQIEPRGASDVLEAQIESRNNNDPFATIDMSIVANLTAVERQEVEYFWKQGIVLY